ncbi:hypothetical protein RDWZM_008872 [Blomia tropicalis]|uniref:NADH dehydrogenase [ubiquinone] 1 beta subcomplex subunit 4 n=1 Tax=Blomia tropicalis TaxID=40697 RepID=A0A9Q0M5F7_BLOTA|nr:hypothetical protein BLOT_004683 [Blomia tropicalis]KAJ6217715.1 hypothetical protein RDWZM_008872 [Blomia tropicalis]
MSPKFHESPEELDRIKRRREIRMRLQHEFNRVAYSPYRMAHHVEVLDPAVSRYTAMRASIYEYWKPNWSNFWKFAFLTHIPIALLSYRLYTKMVKVDEDCKSGKIPYEKRHLTRI